MTVAVCFSCGEFKLGAFNICRQCQARPITDDELTASLLFTDHYYDPDTLRQIGTDMRKGLKFEIDDATREKLAPAIHEFKRAVTSAIRERKSAPVANNRRARSVSRGFVFLLQNTAASGSYIAIYLLIATISFMFLSAIQGNYGSIFDVILQDRYAGFIPSIESLGQLGFALYFGNVTALFTINMVYRNYSRQFVAIAMFVFLSLGLLGYIVKIITDEYVFANLYVLVNTSVAGIFVWNYLWREKPAPV